MENVDRQLGLDVQQACFKDSVKSSENERRRKERDGGARGFKRVAREMSGFTATYTTNLTTTHLAPSIREDGSSKLEQVAQVTD